MWEFHWLQAGGLPMYIHASGAELSVWNQVGAELLQSLVIGVSQTKLHSSGWWNKVALALVNCTITIFSDLCHGDNDLMVTVVWAWDRSMAFSKDIPLPLVCPNLMGFANPCRHGWLSPAERLIQMCCSPPKMGNSLRARKLDFYQVPSKEWHSNCDGWNPNSAGQSQPSEAEAGVWSLDDK